jgi:preprotein translocase subunit SecE
VTDKDRRVEKQNALQRYFRETTGELRKVSWPTGPEARRLTVLVLIVMIIMMMFLGLIDLAASRGLDLLIGVA